jgi:hypothetical protein
LTSPTDRQKALQILDEGMAEGARAYELARLLGVGLTTLQRWRRQFAGDGGGGGRRKSSQRHVVHRLSKEERQRILLPATSPNSRRYHVGRSCLCWRIGACTSAQSAASTVCSTHTGKPIGGDEPGRPRSPERFHAYGRQGRIRCGAGTSPVSPPPSAGSSCTSIW